MIQAANSSHSAHIHLPTYLQIIAVNLPADEISGMREIFLDIDKDGSGSITAEEFAQALRKKGNNLPEEDVQRLVAVRGWKVMSVRAYSGRGLERVHE